ncbi:MAG: hypothetical protein ILA52_02880 [Alphaproteobacteria bacterium]|nr:hypothetical protein [Alphaproteobacteria bacterium]
MKMQKRLIIVFIAVLLLLPKVSRADIDFLALASDKIRTFEAEITTKLETYHYLQGELQAINLNRSIVDQIRERVDSELKSRALKFYSDASDELKSRAIEFLDSKLSNVALPGLAQNVNFGPLVTPQLQNAIGLSYVRRRKINDDVRQTMAQEIKNNKMIVENMATLYANALVARKRIIDEQKKLEKEEETEATDLPTLLEDYSRIQRRANHRWINILSLYANDMQQEGEARITNFQVDDIEDISGPLTSSFMPSGIELPKGKDISGIVNGIGNARSIYENAKHGNWGNVISAAAQNGGEIVGNTGDKDLGNDIGVLGNIVGSTVSNTQSNGDSINIFRNTVGGIANGNWSDKGNK